MRGKVRSCGGGDQPGCRRRRRRWHEDRQLRGSVLVGEAGVAGSGAVMGELCEHEAVLVEEGGGGGGSGWFSGGGGGGAGEDEAVVAGGFRAAPT